MHKRKANSAAGLAFLKFLASRFEMAEDLPDKVSNTSKIFGRAAAVPVQAKSLRWIASLLRRIAAREPFDDLLQAPGRPGRPIILHENALKFVTLCAKGMSDKEAAEEATGGDSVGNLVTLRRYARKLCRATPSELASLFSGSGLTDPDLAAIQKRFQTKRVRARS